MQTVFLSSHCVSIIIKNLESKTCQTGKTPGVESNLVCQNNSTWLKERSVFLPAPLRCVVQHQEMLYYLRGLKLPRAFWYGGLTSFFIAFKSLQYVLSYHSQQNNNVIVQFKKMLHTHHRRGISDAVSYEFCVSKMAHTQNK